MSASEYFSNGSILYLKLAEKRTGSCGIMEILDLNACLEEKKERQQEENYKKKCTFFKSFFRSIDYYDY